MTTSSTGSPVCSCAGMASARRISAETDSGSEVLAVVLVAHVLAHVPLHQFTDQLGHEQRGILRLAAHDHAPGRLEIHHRRRRVLALEALQHDRAERLVHLGDAGVGGAEVDAVGSHVTSLLWEVLVKSRLQRSPHTPGVPVGEPGRQDLGHRVVLGFVSAGRHRERVMAAGVERVARLGGEHVDPAALQ